MNRVNDSSMIADFWRNSGTLESPSKGAGILLDDNYQGLCYKFLPWNRVWGLGLRGSSVKDKKTQAWQTINFPHFLTELGFVFFNRPRFYPDESEVSMMRLFPPRFPGRVFRCFPWKESTYPRTDSVDPVMTGHPWVTIGGSVFGVEKS